MNSIATAISNGRTDTSFVDDLNALRGTVNSRVALLLRSIEVHPLQLRCVVLSEHTPPHFHSPGAPTHAGVFTFAKKREKKTRARCAQTVSIKLVRHTTSARTTWNCGGLCSPRPRSSRAMLRDRSQVVPATHPHTRVFSRWRLENPYVSPRLCAINLVGTWSCSLSFFGPSLAMSSIPAAHISIDINQPAS